MKLFHVSQSINGDYDTYSDFVVCCKDEKTARFTHPSGTKDWNGKKWGDWDFHDWCAPKHVKVTYIGEAEKGLQEGVICDSFHAG